MNPNLDVLVVDDDFRVAAVHKGFVERVPGFRVVGVAHTAAAALEQATTLHPDVVLMDVYLPDGDGLQVLRLLQELPDPPTALVISAASDATAVKFAIQLGAAHYLVKPFGFRALADRLEAIRETHGRLHAWPLEPTQQDVDRLFQELHRSADEQEVDGTRLAPTLTSILSEIRASSGSLSASEVAQRIGISRATAQRYLAQLEQSQLVSMELRYGATGRPEHRYAIRQLGARGRRPSAE